MFSVLNCARLLTRLIPYIFEDLDWRGFFWSSLPSKSTADDNEGGDDILTLYLMELAVLS